MNIRFSSNHILVSNLTKQFQQPDKVTNKTTALSVIDGLSLTIKHGEIVALIGRSGCGKTTLLHCLANLIAPDSGVIDPPEVSSQSAVVFQDHRLLPWATLENNLRLALRARKDLSKKEISQCINKMLAALGLSAFADNKPAALSGGMAQRAALGRALLQDPQLLLMDEPFASLDALTRMDMHELLLSLHAEQPHTILFVTHDLEEAIKLADRVLVMAKGRIIEDCAIDLDKPRDLDSRDIRDIQKHLRCLVTKRSNATHQHTN